MLYFTCHILHVSVTCHMSLFFWGQSGGARWWRDCYQRGLPHLVPIWTNTKLRYLLPSLQLLTERLPWYWLLLLAAVIISPILLWQGGGNCKVKIPKILRHSFGPLKLVITFWGSRLFSFNGKFKFSKTWLSLTFDKFSPNIICQFPQPLSRLTFHGAMGIKDT